jgi:hypothetical protein
LDVAAPIFNRTELGQQIGDRLMSTVGLSGLFLTAPRRTGKSTLLKEDILPHVRREGAQTIYVDLWSDKTRDPAELIAEAVRHHLAEQESALLKWMRRGGLDKVKYGGIELDISKVGTPTGTTITRALEVLSQAVKQPIVLAIDEVQHVIRTEAGMNALFALKAARDSLNGSEMHGFRLIATGSNKDKLSVLVQGKDQAFYHARLFELEPLGDDYLEWELRNYDGKIKPTMETLREAFEVAGNRPEAIRRAFDDLAFKSGVTKKNVDPVFLDLSARVVEEARCEFIRQYNSLPPLQAAIMMTMSVNGVDYAPFRTPTVAQYKSICSQLTPEEVKVDSVAIHDALEELRSKNLVWKSTRGVYALDDPQHAEWLVTEAKEFGAQAIPKADAKILRPSPFRPAA